MASSTTIFLTVAFGVGVITFGVLYYLSYKKNQSLAISQTLLPFSSTIDPTTGSLKPLVNASGNPQISCPDGFSVNIVGAFFDIYDPFGECTSSPSPMISSLCNPSVSYGSCQTDADCPYFSSSSGPNAMSCVPGTGGTNVCSLVPQTPSTTCPSPLNLTQIGSNYYCIPTDVCGPGVPNPTCSASSPLASTNRCAARDASATIAKVCDGQQSCLPTLANFGDMPCLGLPSPSTAASACISGYDSFGNPQWTSTPRQGYCSLPYLPGWSGGPPVGSTSGTPSPASSNLGYTVHGIYSCIPN
jgi:hypothetical protein